MGKYSKLYEFLRLHKNNKITLTLKQIELIINSELPPSASTYPAWWKSPDNHCYVNGWTNLGWSASAHSDNGKIECVNFIKK